LAQSEWQWKNPLPQGYTLHDLFIFDANLGGAVGRAGTILTTANGGANWSLRTSGTGEILSAVQFIDANTALILPTPTPVGQLENRARFSKPRTASPGKNKIATRCAGCMMSSSSMPPGAR